MMISTKGRYALRVMLDLAGHRESGYIPLAEIAARQKISEKYLESILSVLSNFGEISGSNFKSAGAGALSDRRARKRRRLPSGQGAGGLLGL